MKDTSSAKIIKNIVYKNNKANIALGGSSSNQTIIFKNVIKEGCAEGIFVYKSNFPMIYYNKILDNYVGIIIK